MKFSCADGDTRLFRSAISCNDSALNSITEDDVFEIPVIPNRLPRLLFVRAQSRTSEKSPLEVLLEVLSGPPSPIFKVTSIDFDKFALYDTHPYDLVVLDSVTNFSSQASEQIDRLIRLKFPMWIWLSTNAREPFFDRDLRFPGGRPFEVIRTATVEDPEQTKTRIQPGGLQLIGGRTQSLDVKQLDVLREKLRVHEYAELQLKAKVALPLIELVRKSPFTGFDGKDEVFHPLVGIAKNEEAYVLFTAFPFHREASNLPLLPESMTFIAEMLQWISPVRNPPIWQRTGEAFTLPPIRQGHSLAVVDPDGRKELFEQVASPSPSVAIEEPGVHQLRVLRSANEIDEYPVFVPSVLVGHSKFESIGEEVANRLGIELHKGFAVPMGKTE